MAVTMPIDDHAAWGAKVRDTREPASQRDGDREPAQRKQPAPLFTPSSKPYQIINQAAVQE